MRHSRYSCTSEAIRVSGEAELVRYVKGLGRPPPKKKKEESMGRHLKYLFHRH